MAAIIDFADAIVTALNGQDFSQEFTAVRRYRPEYDLADMGTLHVTVVPKSSEAALETRAQSAFHDDIDIAVQQRAENPNDSTTLDALMTLVQEIGDFCRRRTFTGGGIDATCLATASDPIYDPTHLRDQQLFTAVVTVTLSYSRTT